MVNAKFTRPVNEMPMSNTSKRLQEIPRWLGCGGGVPALRSHSIGNGKTLLPRFLIVRRSKRRRRQMVLVRPFRVREQPSILFGIGKMCCL